MGRGGKRGGGEGGGRGGSRGGGEAGRAGAGSRGKSARAGPVEALYAAGRVRHAGAFPALEDEMCGLIAGGGYEGPGRSPDRADALVWALTGLMLGAPEKRPGIRVV